MRSLDLTAVSSSLSSLSSEADEDEKAHADEDRRHNNDVGHDLAVEAADVPAVQHHDLAHVEEQQLDEVHELRHGIRHDDVEDVARLAQDLIEADEDAQVGDDAEVLKHAEGAGDHGAAHDQYREEEPNHE